MKLDTFVKWPFLVIMNKSPSICLNILGDCVIQSLKSGKTRKSGLIPMSRQEKLAELFLVFPARLQTRPKRFISIPSLNVPKMRPSGAFSQFYQTGTMETMTVTKLSTSVLAMYFQVT